MINFLKKKRKMLDDKDFNKKFKAMYNENKTNKLSSIIYNSIFCFRRLMLILSFYLLQEKGIWLVLAFNFVQTVYFIYITNVIPHTEPMHNSLEDTNEYCLIVIQYMTINFILGVNLSVEA